MFSKMNSLSFLFPLKIKMIKSSPFIFFLFICPLYLEANGHQYTEHTENSLQQPLWGSELYDFYSLDHHLRELYLKKYRLTLCKHGIQSPNSFNNCSKINKINRSIKRIKSKKDLIQSSLISKLKSLKVPKTYPFYFHKKWRHHSESFILESEHLEREPMEKHHHSFIFSSSEAKSISIHLINQVIFLKPSYSANGDDFFLNLNHYLEASIQCDGKGKLELSSSMTINIKPLQEQSFLWYGPDNSTVLHLQPTVKSCLLKLKKPKDDLEASEEDFYYSVLLQSKTEPPALAQLCALPHSKKESLLRQTFLSSEFSSYSCPVEIKSFTLLSENIEGIHARAKALLGKPLPQKMLEEKNPYYPLRFTQAPKLKSIFISSLMFRRDFYGTVMERLLRYHAERGTEIYIMISKSNTKNKDHRMLSKLDKDFKNVKVQFFEYNPQRADFKDTLNGLHRCTHIKMFITIPDIPEKETLYVDDEPPYPDDAKGMAIIGGRNIHERFIFKYPSNLSAFPELVQHERRKDFGPFGLSDMELATYNKTLVSTLANHYLTLWKYDDHQEYLIRSINASITTKDPISPLYFSRDKTYVRHLISSPYTDGMGLEKFYSKLINSAKKNISIITPYFRLTPVLQKALLRAIKRGVHIQFITRMALKNKRHFSFIISDINKKDINRFYKNIEIYEYQSDTDLHAKLILIDGELSLVGSVNLNKRSFYHDLENTLVIWSPNTHDKMKSVFQTYKENSKKIQKEQVISFWKNLLLSPLDNTL